MVQYALYMTSHPQFMTSQHSTLYIKAIISHLTQIISDSTSTVSLSSHPDYQTYKPHCMYDNTPNLFMRSHPLYMSTSYPLYCKQQPIHYVSTITATVPVSNNETFHDITPFVYMTLHPIYV